MQTRATDNTLKPRRGQDEHLVDRKLLEDAGLASSTLGVHKIANPHVTGESFLASGSGRSGCAAPVCLPAHDGWSGRANPDSRTCTASRDGTASRHHSR